MDLLLGIYALLSIGRIPMSIKGIYSDKTSSQFKEVYRIFGKDLNLALAISMSVGAYTTLI